MIIGTIFEYIYRVSINLREMLLEFSTVIRLSYIQAYTANFLQLYNSSLISYDIKGIPGILNAQSYQIITRIKKTKHTDLSKKK